MPACDGGASMVVCSAESLRALIASALEDALGKGSQLLIDKQMLAHRLSCSASHIDHLRKHGLPWVRVGDAVRFDPAAVIDWLRKNTPSAEEAER